MPQSEAGMRIDPPVSLPIVPNASPATSAAPLPPLEPPGMRSGAHGFRVGPKCGLFVVTPKAHSWRFVLPTFTAPAANRLAATAESAGGTFIANSFEPAVVATPATSNRSFSAIGTPASIGRCACASMSRARRRASSAVTVMNALSSASRRSIRASVASVSSSAETARRAARRSPCDSTECGGRAARWEQ